MRELMLLSDREEISRVLVERLELKEIAARVGRDDVGGVAGGRSSRRPGVSGGRVWT